MRTYDLHIRIAHGKNMRKLNTLQNLASTLGFAGLAIDSSKPITAETVNKSFELFHRVTLSPRRATRLRFHIRKHTKQADLLVIHGRSKPIWLAAAQIPSVHMVMMKDVDDFKVIDSQVARAMAKENKPIEVCLHNLFAFTGSARSRLMRVMNTAMSRLIRANCSLILTSGASHLCELRAPKDLEAVSSLASVPEDFANNAMNQNPINLVSQIRGLRTSHSSEPERRES